MALSNYSSMALRKITIQIEELQYHRLRQESFDKHIPISELIRIHLEESSLPISHAKLFPSGLSQEDVTKPEASYTREDIKIKEILKCQFPD